MTKQYVQLIVINKTIVWDYMFEVAYNGFIDGVDDTTYSTAGGEGDAYKDHYVQHTGVYYTVSEGELVNPTPKQVSVFAIGDTVDVYGCKIVDALVDICGNVWVDFDTANNIPDVVMLADSIMVNA